MMEVITPKSMKCYSVSFNVPGGYHGATPGYAFLGKEIVPESHKVYPDVLIQGTKGWNTDVTHMKYMRDTVYLYEVQGKPEISAGWRTVRNDPYGYPGNIVKEYTDDRLVVQETVWGGWNANDFRSRNRFYWVAEDGYFYGGVTAPVYGPCDSQRIVDQWRITTVKQAQTLVVNPYANPKVNEWQFDENRYMLHLTDKLSSRAQPYVVESFINACREFPRKSDNMIANLMAMLGMVGEIAEVGPLAYILKQFDAATLRELLGDAWLRFRYEYSTGVADQKQALDYLMRQIIESVNRWNRFDGNYSAMYHDFMVNCHCSFKARLKAFAIPAHELWKSGLELNLYTLWDLIPFSFVVDWFLNIGDRAEQLVLLTHALNDYDIVECQWALHYVTSEENAIPTECYTRWYGQPPHCLAELTIPGDRSSLSTQIKRTLDALALCS